MALSFAIPSTSENKRETINWVESASFKGDLVCMYLLDLVSAHFQWMCSVWIGRGRWQAQTANYLLLMSHKPDQAFRDFRASRSAFLNNINVAHRRTWWLWNCGMFGRVDEPRHQLSKYFERWKRARSKAFEKKIPSWPIFYNFSLKTLIYLLH